MKKVLFTVFVMIGLVGYGQSQIPAAYRDSISRDTILIQDGKTTTVLVQIKEVRYRLIKKIKGDIHLSEAQTKLLARDGLFTTDSFSREWFIKLPLPVIREKTTKQLLYYYLNDNNEVVSKIVLTQAKTAISWSSGFLMLALLLVLLAGFLSGRQKKIKLVLYFYLTQIIFLSLFATALCLLDSSSILNSFGILLLVSIIIDGVLSIMFKLDFGATICYAITTVLVGLLAFHLLADIWLYLLIITGACLISLAIALITKRRASKKKS
jgi:hypothetical protein